MNLLAELYHGLIEREDVEHILFEAYNRSPDGMIGTEFRTALGLSEHEVAALTFGASPEQLVRLRYEGWPTTCFLCGHALDYRLHGWRLVPRSDDGVLLWHVQCPPG